MKLEKDHVHWFINRIVEDNKNLNQLRGFELGAIQDGYLESGNKTGQANRRHI